MRKTFIWFLVLCMILPLIGSGLMILFG